MKRLGFLLIFFTLVLACQKDYNKTKRPYNYIPANTSAVIQVNELNDFIKSIENNDVLSDLYNKEIKEASLFLNHFNTTQSIYIAFKDSNYLIFTENDSTLFTLDTVTNVISKTLANSNIEETQIDATKLYHKNIGNTFAGSNNLDLLKNINAENENTTIRNLIKTTDKKSVASIVFKSEANNYSQLLFSDFVNQGNSNFTVLDFEYIKNGLSYNGILTPKDSTSNYFNYFKNTIPQKTNTPSIAPDNTNSLVSISFDDYSVFSTNNLKTDSTTTQQDRFLNYTNEIALIDNVLALYSLDPNLILESIEDKTLSETFRDIDIYEFDDSDIFKSNLKPFISFENADFFSVFKNFIVFSSSPENLKSVLTDALNDKTLANSDAFKNIKDQLSDEASLFIFKNSEKLADILEKPMNGYNANAVQFIHENHYTHINGIIQKFKKRAASNSVSEAFTTSLNSTLLTAPQVVKNHVTKSHDIVVQDVNNMLYLISSTGNILWKKQLLGQVLGNIEQIDMYKNGRLQLAFATSKRLYVLDRNGNDVAPFPLKFNDPITQPLSVFDYDKRKDYRLLVTQGKDLLMYDAKGQSVNGFRYKNNSANIITQPKHYRIGSKDYIVFGAGESLKILNRQGAVRVSVNDKIHFTDNEIYLYQNKFTTTNKLGQLTQVDTKGKITTKNLDLTDKHHITTTSKTLVSLRDNRLIIKSRTLDLDYGEYTEPRIFYLNDKIYVTTTDLQSKKVYLFDSQAKSIPNFPVFGTAPAVLEKLDNERGLELITQSDDNTIVVYKLH